MRIRDLVFRPFTRLAAVMLSSVLLWGCTSNLRLVSFAPTAAPSGWNEYVVPRQARDAIEKAVVEVAQTGKAMSLSDSDILFIADDVSRRNRVHCIDVVSKSGSNDNASERTVVRYRVVDGMIAAVSDPAREFFIDAELERAVLSAAARTWSPDPVILYNDGVHTMAIASHAISRCSANVLIFEGDAVGTPMASKRVALCFSS